MFPVPPPHPDISDDEMSASPFKEAFKLVWFVLEAFCSSTYPDVFEFPYPGIGLVPPHIAGDLIPPKKSSAVKGSYIASPINRYVGFVCEEFKYNAQKGEFETTGELECLYPLAPFGDLTDLDRIAQYSNYITCDGVRDCHNGEDEAEELCG